MFDGKKVKRENVWKVVVKLGRKGEEIEGEEDN